MNEERPGWITTRAVLRSRTHLAFTQSVLHHRSTPLPRPLVYLQQLKTATPQANGQSDLRHLFAYQPQAMRHLLAFTQAVMRDVGPLLPGECELIAAMTSKDNHCLF